MKAAVQTVNVELDIGGKEYSVDSAVLRTAVNSIPQITVSCWPKANGIEVAAPTILEYRDLYAKLSKDSERLDTECNVKITVVEYDDKGSAVDTQTVSLRKWLLAGAGMSEVSTVAAPHLQVIIQHPICRLKKLGDIYETPNSPFYYTIKPSGTKFTEILDDVYDAYAYAADTQFLQTVDEGAAHAAVYREQLISRENRPSTYLKDLTSLFLAPAGVAQLAMQKAEADVAKPSTGGVSSSTWSMLNNACGMLLMSIVQDEDNNYSTDMLVLEPLQPWKNPSIVFKEPDCEWLSLPGMDTFRITGVLVDCSSMSEEFINKGGFPPQNENQEQVRYAFYSPISNPTKESIGRLLKVGRPQLLVGMYSNDPAFHSREIGTCKKNQDRTDGKAEKLYARAMYYCTARSMVEATASFRLMLRTGGKMIVPGQACTFNAQGKVVYYGYINEVTHEMSTGGKCTTTVNMSYVRSEPGYPGINIGDPNPAYM